MLEWADRCDVGRQERIWEVLLAVRWGFCLRLGVELFVLVFIVWLGSR